MAVLRSQGISVAGYLDDLLLIDQTVPDLRQNVARAVTFLESLSWVLDWSKSALQSVQHLVSRANIRHGKDKGIFATLEG